MPETSGPESIRPSPGVRLFRKRRLSLALAGAAYRERRVRLESADLRGFSHLVATRHGLYAVDRLSFRLVLHGLFYGITRSDDLLYVFEACDLPRRNRPLGRILRLRLRGGEITDADIFAEGLDTSTHQIDMIHGRLCALETGLQVVTRFSEDGRERETLHPLGEDSRDRDYVHVNSLLQVGDRVLLLLHNAAGGRRRASEVAVLDSRFRLLSRHALAGSGCHNLVVAEDGRLLSCGSLDGELIDGDGWRRPLSSDMTRGLSLGEDGVVVGTSERARRELREQTGGSVLFLDAGLEPRCSLALPASPCEIRRIDGRDRSLSAHLNASGVDTSGLDRLVARGS